jgi:hypothetical protein
MLTSIITFDATNLADMLAYSGTLASDLKLLILLAIGLPLGFWVIRKVISLVRAR